MNSCNSPCQNTRQNSDRRGQYRREMQGRMNQEMMHQDRMQRDMMNREHRSLAMSYVPWQKWENLYQPDEGFHNGTIFKDLNLPFTGRRMC